MIFLLSSPDGGLIILLLFLIGIPLYFLPSIMGRKNRNFTAIFLVNLFLGWTLIGWVGALVWAVVKEKPEPIC